MIKLIKNSLMIFSLMALFLSCSKNNVSSNDQNISDLLDCGIDTTFSLPLPAVDIARYSDCRYILAGIYGTEILDVNLGQLSNGLHKLKLSVRVEPFYGETEEITFDIINNSQLNIDNEKIIPKIMSSNYPNPFNPVTTIEFYLPVSGFVNVTIYDIRGNKIDQLVNGYNDSGYRSVQWDATNSQGNLVSAGVYLYSITGDGFKQTKKMLLVK